MLISPQILQEINLNMCVYIYIYNNKYNLIVLV